MLTHELKHQVDVFVVVGAQHVEEADDVGMRRELQQEHDLPEGSLRVRLVPEGVEDLFHRHHVTGPPVDGLPHDAVRLQEEGTEGVNERERLLTSHIHRKKVKERYMREYKRKEKRKEKFFLHTERNEDEGKEIKKRGRRGS